MDKKKIYIKDNQVRFRKSPETTEGAKLLSQGQELEFINGPWVKVKLGDEIGWVYGDYLTGMNPNRQDVISDLPDFMIGQPNLADSPNTIKVREIINDEFHLGQLKLPLNCTEYVQYRVKTKLGIDINWPVKKGRDGGKWCKIFQDGKMYKVIIEQPNPNCAMCFTAGLSADKKINEVGHVAFVEAVLNDGLIKISEANWPPPGQKILGQYNERIISKEKWQNHYKAQFVEFL